MYTCFPARTPGAWACSCCAHLPTGGLEVGRTVRFTSGALEGTRATVASLTAPEPFDLRVWVEVPEGRIDVLACVGELEFL